MGKWARGISDSVARMARIPRLVLLVLVTAGAIAAIAIAVWMVKHRSPGAPPADYESMGTLGKALTRMASSRRGMQIIIGLFGSGAVSLGLSWFLWKDRWWAHAAAALGALAAIPAIWWVHGKFAELEPAGYRAKSPYVQAMTRVADGGTLYFAALAAVALAAAAIAFLAARRVGRATIEKVVATT